MAGGALFGCAIVFSFVALLLTCLGFATDHWEEITVNREAIRVIAASPGINLAFRTDPNYFSRYRGIFKVCYRGNETVFLDNHDDLVSGNCLWINGLSFNSDASTTGYEDEYEIRNNLIRTQLACMVIAMVALLIGMIMASVGCWKLSVRGFRLAGILTFIGAFMIALAMTAFHVYDYLEREEINQAQQGLFPRYWRNVPELDAETRITYSWSYVISWVALVLAAVAAILLLCAASYVAYDEDYNRFSLFRLRRKYRAKQADPGLMYDPGPPPVPTIYDHGPLQPPIIYEKPAPPPPRQIIDVPVEVPVPVQVEPPPVIPVLDDGYGGQVYGGGYGGGYAGSYAGGYGGGGGYGAGGGGYGGGYGDATYGAAPGEFWGKY